MAYIMNINIQADEDIQYILRNIKKSDTGAYVFMSDNRESLINIFCEILRDINETIYTSNKSLDLIKNKRVRIRGVYRYIVRLQHRQVFI